MPDVESQLRQYFDSTVERIDADDVMAGARTATQLQRWDVRARHPFRVVAAAAALMMAAIGAVALASHSVDDSQCVARRQLSVSIDIAKRWSVIVAAGVSL